MPYDVCDTYDTKTDKTNFKPDTAPKIANIVLQQPLDAMYTVISH